MDPDPDSASQNKAGPSRKFELVPRYMFLQVFLSKYVGAESNVVGEDQGSDAHHFNADPEPAFQFNAGPDS